MKQQNPSFHSMQTGVSQESNSVTVTSWLGAHDLGKWSTIMGKTDGKQCATKQKETEEQFRHDYIMSFLNYKALSYNKGCI